jgi:hypothetical protein
MSKSELTKLKKGTQLTVKGKTVFFRGLNSAGTKVLVSASAAGKKDITEVSFQGVKTLEAVAA